MPRRRVAVRLFVQRGFVDRLMMGTDNWPAADIIKRYQQMDALTEAQRRGILYDNAARFFGLSER
jgi:predicted TIM-barrel fold metal-dependent hydrolase